MARRDGGKVSRCTNLICNLTKLFLLRSREIFQQFTLRFFDIGAGVVTPSRLIRWGL